MQTGAMLVEKLWSDGKRLSPRDVVAEFDRTIHDELDLAREAANCSQLRRNFLSSTLMMVPEVYWDWCTSEVMVMQRMTGIPISHRSTPRELGIDVRAWRAPASRSFSPRSFATGSFTPTCTRATSSSRSTR